MRDVDDFWKDCAKTTSLSTTSLKLVLRLGYNNCRFFAQTWAPKEILGSSFTDLKDCFQKQKS